jgi:hypothetical protein
MKLHLLSLLLSSCYYTLASGSQVLRHTATTSSPPASVWYSLRRDARKCASPVCGGYFIDALNRKNTRCADHSLKSECYVAALEGNDSLLVGIQEAMSQQGESSVIVQGYYQTKVYPDNKDIANLVVTAAYAYIQTACDCDTETEACIYDSSVQCDGCNCPTKCVPKQSSMCGGFAGSACPENLQCVDDPSDGCDPAKGGADCGGICQATCPSSNTQCTREIGGSCGGKIGNQCGSGLSCFEDISGGCNSRCGAMDCGGICLPSSS